MHGPAAATHMARGCAPSCRLSTTPIRSVPVALVTIRPAAVLMMSAGTCDTRPSPTVSRVLVPPQPSALDLAPEALARVAGGPGAPLREALFLDTGTTGLAGGSGTLAFLVGVGYFEGEAPDTHFIVDQFFLRDPGQEVGMMTAIDQRVYGHCLLYTSPSPRDRTRYRMPSSA